jgi:hypothetical protein
MAISTRAGGNPRAPHSGRLRETPRGSYDPVLATSENGCIPPAQEKAVTISSMAIVAHQQFPVRAGGKAEGSKREQTGSESRELKQTALQVENAEPLILFLKPATRNRDEAGPAGEDQ